MVDTAVSGLAAASRLAPSDLLYTVSHGGESRLITINRLRHLLAPVGSMQHSIWYDQVAAYTYGEVDFGEHGTTRTYESTVQSSSSTKEYFRRRKAATNGAINAGAGWRISPDQVGYQWDSSASGIGGFATWMRFIPEAVSTTTNRFFVGMYRESAAPSYSTNPSSWGATFGICKDSGDTNLQFLKNSTKTDMGITLASLQGKVLDMWIIADRGQDMHCILHDLEDDTVYEKTEVTGLPVTTSFGLLNHLFISTGPSTSTIQSLSLVRYVGTRMDF